MDVIPMNKNSRLWNWLTFRLFNFWHTIGFLFKPFLTIGVCLVLTVILNAVLFLVMQRLPQNSTLYSLIYALITGVTASFFVSICVEFSNNYRNNHIRALELSEYFHAMEDFVMDKKHQMYPECMDMVEDEALVPPLDSIQAVWYSLPKLMPVIQRTYEEKKSFLSFKEMESMKQILHMFHCIKRGIQTELKAELGDNIHPLPIGCLPEQIKAQLSPEYLHSLQNQEYDRAITEMVDRIFDDKASLKSAMDNWIPVGKQYLDGQDQKHLTSSLLSTCCRSIMEELEELEKPILKEPVYGYFLKRKKEIAPKQILKERKMKKPRCKKALICGIVVLTLIVIAFLLVVVPLMINAAYLANGAFITAWKAEHVLDYYGTVLSFVGTVVLGIVAVWQTQKANGLSRRMLDLEENEGIPMVDLCQVKEKPSELPKGTYRSALQVFINNHCFRMTEDNAVFSSDADILVFKIQNVSSAYITSLEITDVRYSTCINDQQIYDKNVEFEICGGVRALSSSEELHLMISGAETTMIFGKEVKDLYAEEYEKRFLELEITFQLCNIQGKKYRQTVHLYHYPAHETEAICYPTILRKDPPKIEPIMESK